MSSRERWTVHLADPRGDLRLYEPDAAQVKAVAAQLCEYYNEPFNSAMMTNSGEMTPDEVLEHFDAIAEDGGRAFLLEFGGALVGDGDFRHFRDGLAEYALMIGNRSLQGMGLGTRFGGMAHALLFRCLGARRAVGVVVPTNRGSIRMLEKLGYEMDNSPEVRSYVEDERELTMSLERERFEELHTEFLSPLVFSRETGT